MENTEALETERVCLNCGATVRGRYCHECGQLSATPQKLTMATFWKSVSMSFARMTPGFWPTFVGLIVHPWEIIRQYLHGKRQKYSPPVTMVIQLILYTTFFYTVLGHFLGFDFQPDRRSGEHLYAGNWMLNQIMSSTVILKIIMAGSVSVSCYVAYDGKCGKRYNFAEYFTAGIYMLCCFSIYNSLLRPLDVIFNHTVASVVKLIVDFTVGTLALLKAFPIRSRWRRLLRWLWFMTLNVLISVAVVLILVLVLELVEG